MQTKHCKEVVFFIENNQLLLRIVTYSADNGEAIYISFHHPVSTLLVCLPSYKLPRNVELLGSYSFSLVKVF